MVRSEDGGCEVVATDTMNKVQVVAARVTGGVCGPEG